MEGSSRKLASSWPWIGQRYIFSVGCGLSRRNYPHSVACTCVHKYARIENRFLCETPLCRDKPTSPRIKKSQIIFHNCSDFSSHIFIRAYMSTKSVRRSTDISEPKFLSLRWALSLSTFGRQNPLSSLLMVKLGRSSRSTFCLTPAEFVIKSAITFCNDNFQLVI